MNESEFQEIADQTIEDIQNAIDNSGADIDYDDIGGVLTLEFDNGLHGTGRQTLYRHDLVMVDGIKAQWSR